MSDTEASQGRWLPVIYFGLGQAGWFACVLSAAHGHAWLGEIAVLLLLAAHLWRVAQPRQELNLIVTVALIGAVWETVMVHLGWLTYPDGAGPGGLAPLWLLALWGLFAAQFNTTYRWLKTRMFAAVLLGMVAGPLSFRSGAALGALRFAKPWPAAFALACGWGILLPVVVLLSRRWNGVERHEPVPIH